MPYAKRLKALKDLMRAQDISALLVTHPANRYYLSGFELHDGQCNESSGCLLLRTDGPELRELIERTRRDRRADFSVCDVQVPARVPNSQERERSWWSIIPFIN